MNQALNSEPKEQCTPDCACIAFSISKSKDFRIALLCCVAFAENVKSKSGEVICGTGCCSTLQIVWMNAMSVCHSVASCLWLDTGKCFSEKQVYRQAHADFLMFLVWNSRIERGGSVSIVFSDQILIVWGESVLMVGSVPFDF